MRIMTHHTPTSDNRFQILNEEPHAFVMIGMWSTACTAISLPRERYDELIAKGEATMEGADDE